MSGIIVENMCRLCLNDYFPINNIFHDLSTKDILLYEVLNFVYNLEVSRDDGLPPNICSPCLLKVREFEVYKSNAHIAKKELLEIITKNSVKKEVEADGKIIAGQENGSGLIIKTEAVLSNANVIEDDTLANNLMDIPSEMMEKSASLEHFNEMEIIPVVIEKCESQEEEVSAISYDRNASSEEDKSISQEEEVSAISLDIDDSSEEDNSISKECSEVRIKLKCHHCGEKRDTKQEIAQHIEDTHNSIFNEDNAPLQDPKKDKIHMLIHTGEMPLQCNIFTNGYSQKAFLKVHMQKHTGEKPFQCNICNNRYSQNGNLKRHMRTHTGEKPFQCNICNNSYSQNEHLKAHMRKHTGEKPYQCNICNNSFSVCSTLKVHMRTHTGEKPFQCNICNNGFSRSGDLKRHMRKHTGEKPFQCDICNIGYSDIRDLKVHMQKHIALAM